MGLIGLLIIFKIKYVLGLLIQKILVKKIFAGFFSFKLLTIIVRQ